MRRRAVLLLVAMGAALVVVGGVAYALTFITCEPGSTLENLCVGTDGPDNITGTSGDDVIHAKAGNDTVDALGGNDYSVRGGGERDTLHGRNGDDELSGDGANEPPRDRRDYIYGEGGQDTLDGEGGDNRYFGQDGADRIDAAFSTQDGPKAADGEIIRGGPGNDDISTKDGLRDIVYCGLGNEDIVRHDPVPVDVISDDCEIRVVPE
jgi:Ca2+-binding RTX toxin-like protein